MGGVLKKIFRTIVCFLIVVLLVVGVVMGFDFYHYYNDPDYYRYPDDTKSTSPTEATGQSGAIIEKTFDAYSFLSDDEKGAYDQVSGMLKNFKSKALVDKISKNEMNRVLYAVQSDHPEYFWVGEFSYYGDAGMNNITEISVEYPYGEEEKNRRQAEIEVVFDDFEKGVTPMMNEYDKVKYTYDYVIKNTQYVVNPPEDQNMYSVFVEKESVCAGYARATQYLLRQLEIECSYVTGEAIGQGSHAWNIVRVDGDYYYLDATWGEFNVADSSEAEKNITYDYFCVTTEDLVKTHTFDQSVVRYPELTATAASYFVREEKIFDLNDTTEEARLAKDIKSAKDNGEKYYHFKLTGPESLETAEYVIGDVLGSFIWYENQNKLSKTVVLY